MEVAMKTHDQEILKFFSTLRVQCRSIETLNQNQIVNLPEGEDVHKELLEDALFLEIHVKC
jgi:hypothetical protein